MGLFGVLSVFGRRIKRDDTVTTGAGVDVQRHVARPHLLRPYPYHPFDATA
jgi:hypothetical protein